MAIIVGPSDWWLRTAESLNALAVACPVGTTLPDGSRIICKNGIQSWIVAPCCTQVFFEVWNGFAQYGSVCTTCPPPTGLGKCTACICEWPTLNSLMLQCGFNPSDWFVPCISQLQNPGYSCRTNWDFSSAGYWSSTEYSSTCACFLCFSNGLTCNCTKANFNCVRAFRCVTY